MLNDSILAKLTKTYADKNYKHTTILRHKGTLIAFAMNDERRTFYSILDLSGSSGTDSADTTNAKSPLDTTAWLPNAVELIFPAEITEVGFGVAGNTMLPVFKKDNDTPEAVGSVLPAPDEANRNKYNYFRSTTARLSADAPFQVLSDGQYIYLFRQAVADGRLDPSQTTSMQMVNATLLADRFLLSGTRLMPKMEVRFQRSRSKTHPASRKDSLGAKDLDGNAFFEPTQELKFVGNLTGGRFSVLLLPTQVAEIQRWQIFTENSRTGRMDSFNVERSTEGLFNTRGTADFAAEKKGFTESALQFTETNATAHVTLNNGPVLGTSFTYEAWIKPVRRDNDTNPLALIGSEGAPEVSRTRPKAAPSIWIERQTRLFVGFGDGHKTWFEYTSKSLLTPEEWNHIAVSFDGTSLRFFVNGKLRDKTETANFYLESVLQTTPDADGVQQSKREFFKNKPLKIRTDGQPDRERVKKFGHSEHTFCGTVDEIRIWQRTRSQRELSADMNRRLTGLEPDLAGYWRFDEASGTTAFNDTGNDGTGTLHNVAWVASDAPVSEHPGINRSSFRINGRTFASSPAAMLYYQQTEASTGYDGKKKPLKQNGRVMLVVATNDGIARTPNLIAALDFGVSATGRLAQIADILALQPVNVESVSNTSLNDLLNDIAKLQAQYRTLDEDVNRLEPVLAKVNDALSEEASFIPNIVADLTDSALSGLNDQLTALKNALIELKEAQIEQNTLDNAFNNARVTVYQDAYYHGDTRLLPPGIHNLAAIGFSKIISSLKISGPVQVVLIDKNGNRRNPLTGDTKWVGDDWWGDDWDDRATNLEISETAAHAALRTVVAPKQTALGKVKAKLIKARDTMQTERDEKAQQRDNVVKPQLNAGQTLVTSGASAAMPSVSTDQFGLSICGGLLSFAWSNSTPLLFDSATGSLALYFQGIDNQFFVAYYDTRTERARYELRAQSGIKTLTCFARSTDADMDKIVIEVSDTKGDDTTCQVIITGAGIEETWGKVPRKPADFAKVLNGEAAEHSFIGSGALSQDGTQLTFSNVGGAKRAIPKGATIAVGDARFVAQQDVVSDTTNIQVKKTDETQGTSTVTLPVFFIGYDYYANTATTSITADLYNGSLLIFASTEPQQDTQLIGNQRITSGTTLSCKWTADAPGTTLNFDGKKQRAELGSPGNAAKLATFSTLGDLTFETWARPSRVTGDTRLIHHRSDSSAYALGLEKHDLVSALELNGTSDFIDLGKNIVITGAFSQEVWIFPKADDDNFHGILGGGGGNLSEGRFRAPSLYIVEKTKIHAGFGDGTNWHSFITPDSVLKPGDWNHVAVSFDGTSYKLYVNGIQRFSANDFAGRTPLNNPVQFIGKIDNFFPGKIDDVRIWKRTRKAEDILADMNRRLGGNETDLVGYWHFEGGAATDYSRNNNNGIISGQPKPTVSPLSAYKVFAGVNDQMLRSRQIIPAGNWTHLAATYDQAYGLEFDGNYNYLDCGNDVTLDLNQDLSIEVFCQFRQLGRDQLILQRGDFENPDTAQLVPYTLMLNAENRFVFAFENVDGEVISCVSSSSVAAGFHKIAVTRSRRKQEEEIKNSQDVVIGSKVTEWFEMKLYVNGSDVDFKLYKDGDKQGDEGKLVKYETTQPDSDNFRKPVEVGTSKDKVIVGKKVIAPADALKGDKKHSDDNVLVNAFGGAVSEIRIWSTARDHFAAADGKSVRIGIELIGKKIKGDEKGLVSWWRFQEGNGSRAVDSKSQNHAVIHGAKWVNSPDPNGSKLTLYVNGEQQLTELCTHPLKTTPSQFTLGALRLPANKFGEHFQGEMEEMRVWQTTRTEEQIQDNLFRSLIERKNAGKPNVQVLAEEQELLIAYYTFDANPANLTTLGDHSLRSNDLTVVESPSWLLSTAPVSNDTPLVRSALAGVKNLFNGLIDSTPAVQEYADMQYDNNGNLIGVFKRCYGYIAEDKWHLVTGYKVGDMAAEWIGQVQFAPELIGFIEGAPPVPSENLTTRSVEGIGDVDDYNQASYIELVQAEETTYTYAASRDKGFDMSVEFMVGILLGFKAEAGFGLMVETADVENVIGLKGSFENALGWLQDASTSVGRTTGKSTSIELRGRFTSPKETEKEEFGRRFVPDNVGQALVRSETADVFAFRLLRNGALISYSMRPNPDIPKDWNIISFPINPFYVKQGTLDGKIGLKPDVDYPNALTYSPDSSYFKPIEAYALKNRINRAETDLKTYFEQYAAETLGRRQEKTHFTQGDLAVGRMLDELPQLHKRNIVNTYVWTADGGLFAETLETMDSQQEMIGGSYEFKGMAGLHLDLSLAIGGAGIKFGLDALFGGHLNLSVTKTQESKSSFALNVNLDKVERDIYQRQPDLEIELDTSDPLRPKPKKTPGKVDAYRFMSFYLEPESDHYEQFFSKIVDPIWLEQSDDPAAVALRGARQPGKKPPCWRVLHRVTYVSRILPPLDLSAPPSLEKTLQTLDIESNYELIKQLEPYVTDKLSTYPEFSEAVEDTIERLLPELLLHKKEVKEYLTHYFSIAGSEDTGATDAFGQATLQERVPNQLPIVNAGQDQTIGLDGIEVKADLEAVVIDDRLDKVESLFVTWEKISGPDDVIFDDLHATKTKATFTKRGRYELRLTASDGALQSNDTLTIIVNERPVIATGPNQDVHILEALLAGQILDSGLGDPATGVLTVQWLKSGRLGNVVFEDENALQTKVTFEKPGNYLLQLLVTNDSFATTAELTVSVAARVTRDIQVLYTFEENGGQTVKDASGTGTPLDVQIPDLQKIGWLNGALKLKNPTLLTASGPINRLNDVLKTSNEITLEAWLKPAADNVPGLARILTFSSGPAARNFTLAQSDGNFHLHLRTDTTNDNASNKALAGGTVANSLTHLVCTRDASGLTQMFVNGAEIASRTVSGSFSNWANDFQLALGNEIGGGTERAWLGELHLVAIYSRALTFSEIQQNLNFGANLDLPPVVSAGADAVVNWADFDWSKTTVQKKTISLNGRVTHDRPTTGTIQWAQIGGPVNGVVIQNENAAQASVEVAQKGRYAFRLSAQDGELLSSDETVVVVNVPPNVEIKTGTQKVALTGATVEAALVAELKDSGLGDMSSANALTFKWSRIGGLASVQISDSTLPQAKANFTARGFYLLQLEVNNGTLAAVFPIQITVNQMPVVSANAPTVITLPTNKAVLGGVVVDSGLGNPSDVLNILWGKISGPGTVTFADSTTLQTTATFSAGGVYNLRLTAKNPANPELQFTVNLKITVNRAPVVIAGPAPAPLLLKPGQANVTTRLDATVSDDGLPDPPGVLALKWSKQSGPSNMNITPDNSDYAEVLFTKKGKYVLQLEADDGAAKTVDSVTVVVNTPPIADAGPQQKVTAEGNTLAVQLKGVVNDKGFGDETPQSAVAVKWEKQSGPGSATFADEKSLETTVTLLKQKGVYIFKLTADNGFDTASDTVAVIVNTPSAVEVSVFDTDPPQIKKRILSVQVQSDGFGNPQQDVLTFSWKRLSGTGQATFAPDPNNALQTTVTFSATGSYTLELSVGNGSAFVLKKTVGMTVG